MENTLNRLVLHSINCYNKIPDLWSRYDLITFLIDLSCDTDNYSHLLDRNEKVILNQIKTDYFKKRFTRSRITLKHILSAILDIDNIHDITLIKERNGRIIVLNDVNIYICISYSTDLVAITVAKCKIGMDIERITPQYPKGIFSYPLFSYLALENPENCSIQVIQLWTRLEAYSKLVDSIPYRFLSNKLLPDDAYYLSYTIDERYVLSLAVRREHENAALFFLGNI
jgi:4'-phosphopantetheinyl transferase